ncbi:hypothetical protein Leryth_018066 [Lithospermum erythrorhizon]|nr:hypothetical protein Leryth_018066 [Lithospermum erythrorhizon]
MDIYDSGGLSWADQWDSKPLPSEGDYETNKKQENSSKTKLSKKILNFKWLKGHNKKSEK